MPDFSECVTQEMRAQRARRGWRQSDLAERLGTNVAIVSDLEMNRRRVLADDLPALCRAFDMSLAELAAAADLADLRALRIHPSPPSPVQPTDTDTDTDGADHRFKPGV